jgi:dTDP-4-dehydrorhamnose reductase
VVPTTQATLDVCDGAAVEEIIALHRPDVVLNTAAFHKVEECETNPQKSFAVNAIGAIHLARACQKHRATLVQFSTDYVFDGGKKVPYEETDLPNPLNVYGASKVAGELLIASYTKHHYIVRTSGLYGLAGSSGKGGNFIETMLKKAGEGNPIRVVDDQVLTPTATADLAQAILALVQTEQYGLYHVTCEGSCSWYQFAEQIFALEGVNPPCTPARTSDFPSPVRRPAYSVLAKKKLSRIGLVDEFVIS